MGGTIKNAVKRALKVSEAEAIGQAKGKLKALKKQNWTEQLRLFAAKLTDQMSLSDLMEGIAVIGATVIIKQGIDWTQTPLPKILSASLSLNATQIPAAVAEIIAWLRGENTEPQPQATQAEILEWLMAFALAYVIVHNFGEIVSGATSILKVATTLLAVA